MMWFFAALIVLTLGGVAAVAAGRGRSMSEEFGDRPDVLVPAKGPLGADDLRTLRFSLAFRGYRMDEVDSLLDRLAQEKEQDKRPRSSPEEQYRKPTEAASALGPFEPPRRTGTGWTAQRSSPRVERRRPADGGGAEPDPPQRSGPTPGLE